MSDLTSLSPLDGRYRADVAELEAYFSESALMRYRVRVEVEYLIMLSKARSVTTVPAIDAAQAGQLRELYRNFSAADAAAVAAIDARVNHDVKAIEYWMRDKLDAFGCQSRMYPLGHASASGGEVHHGLDFRAMDQSFVPSGHIFHDVRCGQ